jgi:hypothetical protein
MLLTNVVHQFELAYVFYFINLYFMLQANFQENL